MDALEFIRTRPDDSFLLQNAPLDAIQELGLTLATRPQYLTIIEPEKGSIAIEVIRELIADLRLRADTAAQRRVIVISEAQKLTAVAQNAFLKTLEEPPANTTVILLVSETSTLLPTIVSRCRVLNFKRQATDANQPLSAVAIRFIEANLYERLKLAAELSTEATKFVEALTIEVRKLVRSNPNRYAGMVESVYKTQEYLAGNGNKKFALDRLAMEL